MLLRTFETEELDAVKNRVKIGQVLIPTKEEPPNSFLNNKDIYSFLKPREDKFGGSLVSVSLLGVGGFNMVYDLA